MSERPYFRYSGKELEDLFERSKNDNNVLKNLLLELTHRKSKKARLLGEKINRILAASNSTVTEPTKKPPGQQTEIVNPILGPIQAEPQTLKPNYASSPEKYVVECAKCQTPNFIYALDDKTQYLSCSNCRTPFKAQIKQGVLQTTFNSEPITSSKSTPFNKALMYTLIGFIVLISIYLLK